MKFTPVLLQSVSFLGQRTKEEVGVNTLIPDLHCDTEWKMVCPCGQLLIQAKYFLIVSSG